MKSTLFKSICRLLVVSMVFLSVQSAQAGMIGTGQVVSAYNVQSERSTLLSALNRSEVSSQLQSMGIDPLVAKDRVSAMTDEEVHTLAGKVNQLPAGAMSDWAWVAVAVVIGVAIYLAFGWKK